MRGFKKERLNSSAVLPLLHRCNYSSTSLWLYLEHYSLWVTCSRKNKLLNVSSLQTSDNKDRYLPYRDLTTVGHKEALYKEPPSVAEVDWWCLSYQVPDSAPHDSRRSFPQWWPPQATIWSNLWRSSIASRCIGAYLVILINFIVKVYHIRRQNGFRFWLQYKFGFNDAPDYVSSHKTILFQV